MGKIRGRHNSPGIYTIYTGIQYPNTKKKQNTASLVLKSDSEGGGGEPVTPVQWVFGDKFPIIFS